MQVSVIMPVYNAAPFLERAIQSALEQPQLSELIAIDDASTDHSARILETWAQKTDRLIYLPAISKEPQRASAARNRGLAVATAPFIAFLDADDYYLPGRFNRTEAYFKAHPEVEGVVEPVEVVYEREYEGEHLKRNKLGFKLNPEDQFDRLTYKDIISPGLPITGWTLKKSVIKAIGTFDTKQFQKQDQDYLRKLVYASQLIFVAGINHPSVAAYVHHRSNTTLNQQEASQNSARLELQWLKILSRSTGTKEDRFSLFYRYVIFKYQTASWARWKKVILYPFLFLFEGVKKMKYLK